MAMKFILTVFCGLYTAAIAWAQVIPGPMRTDWSAAGAEQAFGNGWPLFTITDFGAVAGDTLDDGPAFSAALAATGGHAAILYFPAGTYRFESTLTLPDSIIVRGDGADSTLFEFDLQGGPGHSFAIQRTQNGSFIPLTGGLERYSRRLSVSPGQASAFHSGDYVELRQANGAWDIAPASWAAFSVGHLARVDSVSGDSLWIDEALRMDMDLLPQPEIRKIEPRRVVGLECFGIRRIDAGSGGYGFYFRYARNCRMYGVESAKSVYAHVMLEASSHVQVSKSCFHEAYAYDGSGTRGYGILMIAHSGSNLVENCIFRKLRHAMIVKQGANGNVFAYNYSREPFRSEPIPDYAADICLHGHYAFANLFEGNIVQNLQIDIVWGPSGPYNTFFRNKIELYGIIMSSGAVQSDRQVFVGNDISGSTGLYGNYLLQGSGHFEHANNVKGMITPAGSGFLPDTSCFMTQVPPAYWNILRPLPSVGLPNTFDQDINPALYRYRTGSGSYSGCAPEAAETDTSQQTGMPLPAIAEALQVRRCAWQNGRLHLMLYSALPQQVQACVYGINGQQLAAAPMQLQAGLQNGSMYAGTPAPGMYILVLTTADRQVVYKWMHTGN